MIYEKDYQSFKIERSQLDALKKIAHDNNMNMYQLLETICINFLSNPAISEIKVKSEYLSDIAESVKIMKDTPKILSYIAKGCKMTRPELIADICQKYIELLNETAEEELKKEGMTSTTLSPE